MEDETDELLLMDEDAYDVDPDQLPRRVLTSFAVYNAEVGPALAACCSSTGMLASHLVPWFMTPQASRLVCGQSGGTVHGEELGLHASDRLRPAVAEIPGNFRQRDLVSFRWESSWSCLSSHELEAT